MNGAEVLDVGRDAIWLTIQLSAPVLIVGPSGTGKSHLAQALGHCAVRQGTDVLFTSCSALTQTLQHNTRLAVARGLTLATADVRSETVKTWRARPPAADDRQPAVFAIGR